MTVDGGGWTLAVRVGAATQQHQSPGALPITAPFQYQTGKLSDSVINALGGTLMRFNYGDDLAHEVLYEQLSPSLPWGSNSSANIQGRMVSNSLGGPYVKLASDIYTEYSGFGCFGGGSHWNLSVCLNYTDTTWTGMEWSTRGKGALGTVWVR